MEWHSIKTPLSQFAKVGDKVIVSTHTRIQEQDDTTSLPYSQFQEIFLCKVVEFNDNLYLEVENDFQTRYIVFSTKECNELEKIVVGDDDPWVTKLTSEPKYAMLLFAKWANINSISLGDLIEEEESK